MKITPQQARAAFYQAAANIEAAPGLYNFAKSYVGGPDCEACMWGYVGRALSLAPITHIAEVAEHFDLETEYLYGKTESNPSGFDYRGDWLFTIRPRDAAMCLREFADHHWPAESIQPVRPDLIECGQSFVELMRSFGSEVSA
ncbi:MAG: hypothetical protein R3221_12620 [Spongiibacter sp.]|nr:hypothetical protein [Spongiibacter sp.]